jgi:predicted metal-dependent phosphoesterase TrpH
LDLLKTELHCHNEFSNFHQAEFDTPYDCNIGIQEQLDQSHKLGLNCLFVTNHNTLDGYNQLLEFQKNHQKYQNIRIFPAEEITTDEGAHVIAYGIHKEIKPGLSFEETVDEIIRLVYLMLYEKKQNHVI